MFPSFVSNLITVKGIQGMDASFLTADYPI